MYIYFHYIIFILFAYNIVYILCVSSIFMMIYKIDYSSMNFIYAILSFFSFIMGIFISKSITKPITKLIKSVEKIKSKKRRIFK